MMYKKKNNAQKKEKHSKRTEQGNIFKSLTPEELNQMAMGMSWGYGMLPPGCFPYGFWYF